MANTHENVDLATKPEASNGADKAGKELSAEDARKKDVKTLAHQVIALWKLGQLAQDLELEVKHLAMSYEEALAQLRQTWAELERLRTAKDNLHDIRGSELAPEFHERVVQAQEKGPVSIKTGIDGLDVLTGGLKPGVHVLAGEPGAGKTTFAVQLAVAAASDGHPAIFVSFEESTDRIMLRTLCCWYNRKHGHEWNKHLDAKAFEDGIANADDKEAFSSACKEAEKGLWGNLWIKQASSRLSVVEVEDIARAAMEELKVTRCLVVVDYLQRWALTRRGRDDFRFKVSGLVGELRDLALDLQSPVLVISSQNRPGQGEARLVSLKESGDIEYSADTALFLTTDDENGMKAAEKDELARLRTVFNVEARNVTLAIKKNRFGGLGNVRLRYYADRHFFEKRGK
jgi:replicative DNA helicase